MGFTNIGSVGIGSGSGGGGGAVDSVNGKVGAVVLIPADIGLGNVNNTSDVDKPVSTATQTAIDAAKDEALIETKELIIQAGATVEAGIIYNTYADALVYINANGGASYYNRWVCKFSGQVTENIVLQAYVYVSGNQQSGVLVGSITSGGNNANQRYKIYDLQFDSVFPSGASSVVECLNCNIISQDNIAASGIIWLRQGTYMYKDAGNPSITMAAGTTLEVNEGSQVFNIGNFGRVNARTGGYVNFTGSTTGVALNLYDGAATANITDGTTMNLSVGLYTYKGNLYSSGYGYGTNGIINVSNGATSDIINTTTYGVDINIDGAGSIGYINGLCRGQAKTEVVTTSAGGTIQYEGAFMGVQAGNVVTGDDTISCIQQLDAAIDANNGICPLDASSKVPVANLPASVVGGLQYQGTWNATTNTPALASGAGSTGHYYVVSVAGSTNLDGITDWVANDWVVFNGTVWEKIDNTDQVTSVNGQQGVVVLDADDIADAATTNKFATAAEKTKLGFITVTQAVDLDTMESDIAGNQADVITTKGDIVVGDASGDAARKAVGVDGEALIANSAIADGLEYQAIANSVNGSTGTVVLDADDIADAATTNKFATAAQLTKVDFITVTQAVDLDTMESDIVLKENALIADARAADFTAAFDRVHIIADGSGAVVVTLPPLAVGRLYIKTLTDEILTDTVTINTPGVETIDGAASYSLNSDKQAVQLFCDGSNWVIL